MLYMSVASVVGIVLGSFIVWKRKMHFILSVLLSTILTVVLFTIGLNVDAKLEPDPTLGTVYSLLLFFASRAGIVVSILCFLILRLIQLIIRRSNESHPAQMNLYIL